MRLWVVVCLFYFHWEIFPVCFPVVYECFKGLLCFVMFLVLKAVIIGKWSECSFVSIFQVMSFIRELSIAVMSWDVGC